MTDYLAQVILPSSTGLAADNIVNTFAVNQAAAGNLPDIANALEDVYNATPAGLTFPLARYLSSTVSRTADAAQVRLYDIAGGGGPSGSPDYAESWTVAGSGSGFTAIPSEVALVATLEASGRPDAPVETGIGTRPKQRYTGRIYFGPFTSEVVAIVGGQARPSAEIRTALMKAIVKLDNDLHTIGATIDLGVWSRADNVVRPVAFVSVDDAFDTQRRRGPKKTLRDRLAMAEA